MSDLQYYEDRISELERNNNKLREQVKQKEYEADDLERDKDNLKNQIRMLENEKSDLEYRLRTAESENYSLRSQNRDY